ncbi:MAG: ATP-dependent zinc metalloprotease FtsH [Bacteroidales bacterium]|nr:ATP-dependent zinc metalloprotease FtsH [Bacteroidales bacterium]
MPIPLNPNNKKKPFGSSLFWMYAIILLVLVGLFYLDDNSITKDVSYSEFESYIVNDHGIEKIIVYTDKRQAEGFLTDSLAQALFPGQFQPGKGMEAKVIADVPSADKIDDKIEYWRATGAFPPNGEVKYERSGGLTTLLWSFGPILLLIFFWFYMMKRMSGTGGSGGGVFSVGKSKAQVFDKDSQNKVTFKDVAGLTEAKTEIEEIVEFLKNPKRYTDLGGKIPKGALLVGPPGTGKTLLAKAVAGEANVPFFSMSGSDFVEMFVGVGASRVRDLFRQAKEKAPCIVFIDEIDAVGRARGKNPNMGANDERENTLNQLLTEMDGFGSNSGVIILAATNRADILDKALMRAGRFDRQIYVELPDVNDRVAIFKVHLRNIKINQNLDIELLARQTAGFSGADIANVCNEAALIAARHNKTSVDLDDFNAAVDRIIGGLEKKNKLTTNEEKQSVAIHEAGHATVSWHLQYGDPLVKVTIVPRGKALGAAWYLPEERQRVPAQALLDQICSLMAGRASEDVILGSVATGALNDLERATKIAYALVVYYGMSEKLPNISYYDSSGQGYGFTKPYSEERAKIIDEEVSRILTEQYKRAKDILNQYYDGLVELSDELYNREVIFTADVEKIFGKRQWVSRTDEIMAEQKEKDKALPPADATADAKAKPDEPQAPEPDAPKYPDPDAPAPSTPTPPPYKA